MSLTEITSIDPRTGHSVGTVTSETSVDDVHHIVRAAAAAGADLAGSTRGFRATLLRAIADELEAARELIVTTADVETAIGAVRLNGELTRTVYQARLFADVVEEGSYVEATIDYAGPTPMGDGPDLRRMLVPIGPVAVFGSSNFPLAFSVPGGDTISALAGGNPVIAKAHSSHPATSKLTYEVIRRAIRAQGAPESIMGIVYGQRAGTALVAHPDVRAVGFTGSVDTARKLLAVIDRREHPIPFYGELSSLNPVVLTPGSVRHRAGDIAAGLAGSITVSGGQLCTKPGIVFVPAGDDGDRLIADLSTLISEVEAHVLLNERIRDSYLSTLRDAAMDVAATGRPATGRGVPARVWTIDAEDFRPEHAEECFGPSTVVVRYASQADLLDALALVPSSLTGTIHHEPDELTDYAQVLSHFTANAGRVVFNGFPTGVLVSWAQTHGGPWPSTNSIHTSVGTSSVRRFLRPLTWQNAPHQLLPPELQDDFESIPRRVDGRLSVPRTLG